MTDLIIVGSGAAATGAMLGAEGRDILVLDGGIKPSGDARLPEVPRLKAMRDTNRDLYPQLIGEDFSGLALIGGKKAISPKLKTPLMNFITRDWETLSPTKSEGFEAQMSFALGGLANGWGAGVYRFDDHDLNGFPIKASELSPYFDELTKEVGVSGTNDDLTPFFGSTENLQKPLKLNRGPGLIYRKYKSDRARFNEKGFIIGRPRTAVLTEEKDKRDRYHYNNLEFFTPNDSSIYSPSITVNKLIRENRIRYQGGVIVKEFSEDENGVVVRAVDIKTGGNLEYKARKLVISAGCLNTAKIVLASKRAVGFRLPLLDNLVSYVPLVNPLLFGLRTEVKCFGMGQLNVLYKGPLANEVIQGSLYDISGPLRTDFLFDFPLPYSAAVAASRIVAPGMCLMQLFYPDDPIETNHVSIDQSLNLVLNYKQRPFGDIEKEAIRTFRKIGWFGSPRLCRYPKPGNSYHYAGSLPMRESPAPFETHPTGLLQGCKSVYIADSSAFSRLPSKNLTFTSMANAMRVTRGLTW